MVERKNIKLFVHSFDLLPFLPSLLTCRPDLSFFSLFLVALIGLEGAVVFEMLSSHVMGEGRANCSKNHHSSRLYTTLWKPISGIKSSHFSWRPDRHRKMGAWQIYNWAEVTSWRSYRRMYLCRWHRRYSDCSGRKKFCYGNAVSKLPIKLWLSAWGSHNFFLQYQG